MITISLTNNQEIYLTQLCQEQCITIQQFVRKLIEATIEDDYFTKEADDAYLKFLKNPITYTFEDIENEFNNHV